MAHSPGMTERDVLLAVASISFDLCILGLYLPLIVGARQVLASAREAGDGNLLLKRMEKRAQPSCKRRRALGDYC